VCWPRSRPQSMRDLSLTLVMFLALLGCIALGKAMYLKWRKWPYPERRNPDRLRDEDLFDFVRRTPY
jgi:hypothetical protein